VRYRWIILALCLASISSLALGHNVSYHALQGIKLCLDKNSVQVTVNVKGDKPNEEYVNLIKKRLETSLRSTLKNYGVPFEDKTLCNNSRGFVVSIFSTVWSDQDSVEPYYVLVASTQVGETPLQSSDFSVDMVLGGNVFDGFVSDLLLESDFSEPFEDLFPKRNEDGFKDLAQLWWTDNPNGLAQTAYLPQRIGAGIVAALCLIGLIVMLLRRTKSTASKTIVG
jgi:hypothetical protein